MLHVHALREGRAHGPLDGAAHVELKAVRDIIRDFKGTVCAEVFSADFLEATVLCIKEMLNE